jgi:hypothetical protein
MRVKILLMIGLFLIGCYSRKPENTGKEGELIPSFKLLLADSLTYIDTKSIPEGNPVVFLYFGPHCPYSKAQIEEIIEDINILKNIRFYVFTTWSFSEMKEFYNHYQLSKYNNITTGVDNKFFFLEHFEVQGVPYMAIYDKHKKLKKAFVGKVYGKQIKEIAEN